MRTTAGLIVLACARRAARRARARTARSATDVEREKTPRRLDEAVEREAQRLTRGPSGVPAVRQSSPKRGWIKRHPIFSGVLIGFGTGFDFTALFNGVILGGVGAGIGAAAGAILKSR